MFKGPEAERSSSPNPLAHLSRAYFSALALPGFPREGDSHPQENRRHQIWNRSSDMDLELRWGYPLFPLWHGQPWGSTQD